MDRSRFPPEKLPQRSRRGPFQTALKIRKDSHKFRRKNSEAIILLRARRLQRALATPAHLFNVVVQSRNPNSHGKNVNASSVTGTMTLRRAIEQTSVDSRGFLPDYPSSSIPNSRESSNSMDGGFMQNHLHHGNQSFDQGGSSTGFIGNQNLIPGGFNQDPGFTGNQNHIDGGFIANPIPGNQNSVAGVFMPTPGFHGNPNSVHGGLSPDATLPGSNNAVQDGNPSTVADQLLELERFLNEDT